MLDDLRREVAELRASRERLVLGADADLRRIERELHDGVQQQLIAIAVNLQLAGSLLDADPAAAKALLGEMAQDVQQALDDAARLAQRIDPPLLDAGDLAAAVRSAAASAGIPASFAVSARASYPPEVARTVYLCCLGALEHATAETPVSVTLREEDGSLAFDVVVGCGRSAGFDRLRDRVEALGGRLTIRSEPDGATRVSGSLPARR